MAYPQLQFIRIGLLALAVLHDHSIRTKHCMIFLTTRCIKLFKSRAGYTIKDIRAFPQKFAAPWSNDFRWCPGVKDIDIQSDDGHVFQARCYYPDPRTSPFGKGPYPVHIYYHGEHN